MDSMGEKKVKGRKRQLVVDTQGLLHQVLVHKANIHDSKGGAVLADIVLQQQPAAKDGEHAHPSLSWARS